jgi:cytochrome c biogenesis protein CcmG/thiol:disulfide interchange protein DsbE
MRGVKIVGQLGALALVLSLFGLLAWKVVGGEDGVRVGDRAPHFELPVLGTEEQVLDLASYRGRAVVVNFWASWCGPCRDEAPLLQAAWERHRARGVVVLGVDTRDLVSDAQQFVAKYGLTYPNVYDGPGKLADPYGLTGFPETFFIDRKGTIVEHVAGPLESAEQIEAAIAKAAA